jgi:uncharacterized Zn finger protein (UPF0148 family)
LKVAHFVLPTAWLIGAGDATRFEVKNELRHLFTCLDLRWLPCVMLRGTMFSMHCPHCRKELLLPNDRAGGRVRCHGCDAELQAPQPEPEEAGEQAYTLKTMEVSPSNDQDYVDHLTRRAAVQQERKPYIRSRFPVDLLAGLLSFAFGIGTSLFVILGEGGMMNILVNGFLIPMIFIIIGAGCILSWLK